MKILLLAGTAEARALAPLLHDDGHDVVASLAGVTASPLAQGGEGVQTRIGGFGGVDGLTGWMRANRTDALIDATHPFARQMPWNAMTAAEMLAIPRLRLIRPEWPHRTGWLTHATLEEAVTALPAGARVLATTGGGDTAALGARTDLAVFLRSIETGPQLPPHVRRIIARPPFTQANEAALIETHGITHLLTRNAGGNPAKLEAAAGMGVAVAMVSRPAHPPGPTVDGVADARAWVAQLATAGEIR